MNIVEVFWLDAGLESLQLNKEDALLIKPLERTNVGYLLSDCDEKVILVFGIIEDRDKHGGVFDQTLVIPKGMVTKITTLATDKS